MLQHNPFSNQIKYPSTTHHSDNSLGKYYFGIWHDLKINKAKTSYSTLVSINLYILQIGLLTQNTTRCVLGRDLILPIVNKLCYTLLLENYTLFYNFLLS